MRGAICPNAPNVGSQFQGERILYIISALFAPVSTNAQDFSSAIRSQGRRDGTNRK